MTLDPPRRAVQELLVERHDAGVLVCLSSKNDDADVLAVLDARPDMPLRPAHLAARRVNWLPKSENLRSLAAELGLALDGFVFLDDSPLERAEVRSGCPEVITAELPADPAAVPGFLRHFWALDRAGKTAEDGRRTALYRDERARDEARRDAPDLDAFLDGLGLEVAVAPMTAASLPRAAQLTQRTNQLNVTTKRRTEAELSALCDGGALEALVVDVRDRFGDYGTTGLVLFGWTADALSVDTFLLSCRALGRGVEERVLAHLGRLAEARGRPRVDVPFLPSAKNAPALQLLDAVGAASPGAGRRGERLPVPRVAPHRAAPRVPPRGAARVRAAAGAGPRPRARGTRRPAEPDRRRALGSPAGRRSDRAPSPARRTRRRSSGLRARIRRRDAGVDLEGRAPPRGRRGRRELLRGRRPVRGHGAGDLPHPRGARRRGAATRVLRRADHRRPRAIHRRAVRESGRPRGGRRAARPHRRALARSGRGDAPAESTAPLGRAAFDAPERAVDAPPAGQLAPGATPSPSSRW